MSNAKLLDAVRHIAKRAAKSKDATLQSQESAAFEWLDKNLPAELSEGFTARWRAEAPAPAPRPMTLAVSLIRELEGCKLTAYPDPYTGGEPWTIGWGTTVYEDGQDVEQGDTITQEYADRLLLDWVRKDEQKLAQRIPTWNRMNPYQRAALLSFSYNVGSAWYGSEGFDTITARVKNAEWTEVPSALRLYVNPGSPVEVGLRRRREAEIKLWNTDAPAEKPPVNAPGVLPGMVGPKKTPHEFGFKRGDSHVIVNDANQKAKAYDIDGNVLWELPALARGQGADTDWRNKNTDTPPGLYRLGDIYRDYEQNPRPPANDTAMAYGWYSFDMVELEGQEAKNGRAGIMIHGGGTACGWPGAWAPRQQLYPTLGCIRMHNQDLRDKLLPLVEKGTVYVSVYQEA